MKRILFLGQFPPPVHGVSLMNTYLLNSDLIQQHFDIEVIDLKFGKTIRELESFSFRKVFKAIGYGFQILKKLTCRKCDMVYFTFTPTGLGFYRDAFYILLLKIFRSRIVLHLHGKGIEKNTGTSAKKQLYKRVFKNTHLICLSDRLQADVKDVYEGKPFVVPNGIAVENRTSSPKKKSGKSVLRILFVSNLILNKGVLVLVQALAILKKSGHDFHVRFVGAPSNITIDMLNEKLKECGIDGAATVLGPLYGKAKFEEFENADIFVFPTYNDAFPLVNLEAMQFGLPVVSTFEGSIPDIVKDNETGFLVNREDVHMLAEKISLLLKDENLRITMGANGYERFISNYTLPHFERNILQTFNTVLMAEGALASN